MAKHTTTVISLINQHVISSAKNKGEKYGLLPYPGETTLFIFKGFVVSPVFRHFLISRDSVVSPVSRRFPYSRDLVISPVSRHFPYSKDFVVSRVLFK